MQPTSCERSFWQICRSILRVRPTVRVVDPPRGCESEATPHLPSLAVGTDETGECWCPGNLHVLGAKDLDDVLIPVAASGKIILLKTHARVVVFSGDGPLWMRAHEVHRQWWTLASFLASSLRKAEMPARAVANKCSSLHFSERL